MGDGYIENEPEIVKILREEEKLGRFQSKIQSTYEKLETPDKSLDETSNHTSYIIENTKKGATEDIQLLNVEKKFRTIFENYAIAITLADNKERIISWNKYTEELLNMNESELYLRPVSTLYPAEEWKKIREENVRQKGIKYQMETKMIKKNQVCFDVELSLCVLQGKDNKPVGSIGIIKDITKFKESEKKLKASEKKYRTIFENSAVAIMLANENRQIISWNKFTEDLLDMNKEDLYLKSLESLYPPKEWQKIRLLNIEQKGLQYHIETKMINKNNEIFEVDLSLSVLKNHDESVVGSIGVIQDITYRKKVEEALKESEKKFKHLYEHAPVPYHTLTPDGVLKDVNQKWCEILGFSKNEVIGKPVFDFIIKEEREQSKFSFSKKLRFNKSYIGGNNRTYVTKNGMEKTFVSHDFFTFDKNQKIISIQTIMVDVTDRLKMENRIKESNNLLKIMNRELENKVQDRTKQIQELLKQKDELIQRLGHDLKTPITILMNIIPLIDEEVDNPKAKKDCNTAIRNLIYIKNLVKEILKITELTSSAIELQKKEISLNELINEVLKDYQIIFHVKNITIKNYVNKPIIVNVDEMKIKEVLFNLINNAIKFTPENGEIIINKNEDKETVTILITDNGIGMNKEQLKYIFNEFYKADVSRHNLGGSGLGLSICKKIIEKHDGEIWAESEGEQKGSTFYFKISKINKVIN